MLVVVGTAMTAATRLPDGQGADSNGHGHYDIVVSKACLMTVTTTNCLSSHDGDYTGYDEKLIGPFVMKVTTMVMLSTILTCNENRFDPLSEFTSCYLCVIVTINS